MEYIVKDLNQDSQVKEFYVVKSIKDINDEDVQVAELVGSYSKQQLQSQVENIEQQITNLNNEKTEALNKLLMFE